ncbi:transglutaminaseTgpA domain-containing protein [Actinomadura namibiensis]|uniref:Transglutaminase-like putative cysteine protease n=1 Tax=Actinomadura namibiensis TaxID=182080 RepID=A0A7W3LT27_ACTNM|nr:DUF3488 and transglutaminase-like domain-containing protein [Actinomadura namibiensis]MBA8953722.1 transglutaminase-like putative cysteine protease [Actinomadura namibiensis]
MTVMAALAVLAGSVGLYPLFTGKGWFWVALGSVLAVAVGGTLGRRLRLPAAFTAVAGAAALLVYLTVLFASSQALLGFLPTPGSLGRLDELFGQGWKAVNDYAAPVPLVPGIRLLVGAGVGLVAIVVDLLAVRLRRAAPAGLPLLAMYSVPAAVRQDGIGWAAFAVGALGFLALLMADAREQVGGWGRVVFTPRWSQEVPVAGAVGPAPAPQRPDARSLMSSGRRIAFAAVAVAVLLPTVIPGVQPRGLFGLGGGGGGGTQTVTTPDPLVSLQRELTERGDAVVLTYRTDAGPRPDYLRMYALDQFNGNRWSFSSLSTGDRDRLQPGVELTPAPGLGPVRVRRVTTEVRVSRRVREMDFLPVPYAPARVSVKGDWRVDDASRMIYSPRDSASGRSYTVVSAQTMPTVRDLAAGTAFPSEIARRYTAHPRTVPPEVMRLTREITKGARTAHEQAVMLQRWFTRTGGFRYDLSAPAPRRGDDLVNFLLHDKRGYCEQFAASMALMARILGIPARVAMGYTPGTQSGPNEWTVRSRDAHAWPELYFEGAGWVRFEPTPSGPGGAGQGTATSPSYSETTAIAEQPGEDGQTEPTPSASSSTAPGASESAAPQGRPDPLGDQGDRGSPQEDDGTPPAGWIAGTVLVLALLAAPMVARALARRRRWSALRPAAGDGPGARDDGGAGFADPAEAAAHAAWRELRADAVDHGLEWRPGDTPRQAARRLSELLELDAETARSLGRIARAEEMARYSRSRVPAPAEVLRADVRAVREAFAASVGRTARWRARLLPPSAMAATSQAAQSLGRAVGGRVRRDGGRWGRVRDRLGGWRSRNRDR